MTVASTEQPEPAKRGPSLVIQIAMLLAITAVAIGMGWLTGNYLNARSGGEDPAEAAVPHEAAGHGAAGSVEGAAQSTTVALEPITTNLAAPNDVWVRLEVALVFDAPPEPTLADTIHQDLLAYLRTVKMHQIEGASGFLHLKADLEERAAIRSDGLVKGLLIRTLIFE